jgi:hypothetical protein
MKLSELPQITANNITEADLIYLVQNGASYAVNVVGLAEYVLESGRQIADHDGEVSI